MANDKRDSSKRPASSRTGASGPAKKKAPARSSQTKRPASGRPASRPAGRRPRRAAANRNGAAAQKKPAGTRKKNTRGRKVVIILLVVLIVISLLFIFFTGRYLYLQIASPKESASDTPLSSYDTTPETDVDQGGLFRLRPDGCHRHRPHRAAFPGLLRQAGQDYPYTRDPDGHLPRGQRPVRREKDQRGMGQSQTGDLVRIRGQAGVQRRGGRRQAHLLRP